MAKKIILLILLIVGLVLRLYKITNPIADWHSFRQADTSSVTRNYLTKGIDLLRPTYHDLSNIQSGLDNPQGYRMVEFPIYNAFSAVIYQFTNPIFNLSLEVTQRLINIILSLISSFLIFLIVKKITQKELIAYLSMAVFLFLPFNIYYSRAILPEATAVIFMLLAFYFLLQKKEFLSALFLALSLLIKPYTALILGPTLFLLFIYNYQKNGLGKLIFALFKYGLISLLPFAAWRLWIRQFPQGIPVSNWLFNLGNMRFKPAWFRWLFYERIAKLIMGAFGLIPLFLGFAYKKNHSQTIMAALGFGIILYFSVIARGNIQHDYYQVLIIPSLSIISGLGLYYIISILFSSTIIGTILAGLIFTSTIVFSWYQVKDYYLINNPIIIEAGQTADKLLPKNAKVIAPYTGDTAFLYQTNRSGWPTEIYEVAKVKQLASPDPLYLVSVNYDTYTNSMIQKYPILYKSDKFIILNLN